MLDTRQLQLLCEVAARGSFSAAAEALAYTQPAVSQQIAALERSVGTPLFRRMPRGVKLTEAGELLLHHAKAILSRSAEAEKDLHALEILGGARLRVGSFASAAAVVVPPVVSIFSGRFPQIDVTLCEAEPDQTVPMIRSGDLDVAIVAEHDSSSPQAEAMYVGLDLHHLLEEPMHVMLRKHDPLTRHRRLRLEQLANELWIDNNGAGGFGACTDLHVDACRAAGFEPKIKFHSDDLTILQGMVAAGLGIALVPGLVRDIIRDDVEVRSLGPSAPRRMIAAATLPESDRSASTNRFLSVLLEVTAHRRTGPAAGATG